MLDQVGRYESYRDSGVDWIGDVPADWNVTRLKFIFRERSPRTRTGQETLYSLRMNEGLVPHDEVSDKPIAPEDLVDYKLIAPGQVVMNRMRAAIGIFGVAPAVGLVSPDYAIFDVDPKTDAQFFLRVFKTTLMSIRFRLASKGMGTGSQGFMRLYTEEFGDIKVAVPPLETQRQIVKAVDEKTAEIDEAIGKKRRLIELLNEQKAILINQAVTRGLDPSVPMKDSGVDWIGEIPAHWDVKRVKHVAQVSPSKSGDGVRTSDMEVVFLPMEAISTDGSIIQTDLRSVRSVIDGFTYFQRNDVVVAKITPCFENGKGAVLNELETDFGFGTTELHVFRPHSIKGQFLFLVLNRSDFLRHGEEFMEGSAGQKRVPTNFIANYSFPLPPEDEQVEIVEKCASMSFQFQECIAREAQGIQVLTEFKQTLIANAVTGKIKI